MYHDQHNSPKVYDPFQWKYQTSVWNNHQHHDSNSWCGIVVPGSTRIGPEVRGYTSQTLLSFSFATLLTASNLRESDLQWFQYFFADQGYYSKTNPKSNSHLNYVVPFHIIHISSTPQYSSPVFSPNRHGQKRDRKRLVRTLTYRPQLSNQSNRIIRPPHNNAAVLVDDELGAWGNFILMWNTGQNFISRWNFVMGLSSRFNMNNFSYYSKSTRCKSIN
jgi:hypothetical protein